LDNSKSWEIVPAGVGIQWGAGRSFIYNGRTQGITAEAVGLLGTDTVHNSSLVLTSNNAVNAGEYTAEVAGISNPNYRLGQNAEKTKDWAITPAEVTVKWGQLSNKYTGKEITVTAEAVGLFAPDSSNNSALILNGNIATNVGKYTAEITGIINANYRLSPSSEKSKGWEIVATPENPGEENNNNDNPPQDVNNNDDEIIPEDNNNGDKKGLDKNNNSDKKDSDEKNNGGNKKKKNTGSNSKKDDNLSTENGSGDTAAVSKNVNAYVGSSGDKNILNEEKNNEDNEDSKITEDRDVSEIIPDDKSIQDNDSSNTTSKSNVPLWPFITGGLILIVGGAALYLVFKRR
jgi:hypothetical protein